MIVVINLPCILRPDGLHLVAGGSRYGVVRNFSLLHAERKHTMAWNDINVIQLPADQPPPGKREREGLGMAEAR